MNRIANLRTLGLPPDATWDDVRSAFRRLARTYHPDVAGSEGAHRFAQITAAYTSLKECAATGTLSTDTATAEDALSREQNAQKDGSFWKRLIQYIFPWGNVKKSEEREVSPARKRFIESSIARAEAQVTLLLSRRAETKAKNRVEAIICRLCSKHPAVALLALRSVTSKDSVGEIRAAALAHFTRNLPATEVLEPLLQFFSGCKETQAFARCMAQHATELSPSDAQMTLRWFVHSSSERECFVPFLNHSEGAVVAMTLGAWRRGFSLPDTADIAALLRTEDEVVLSALLRLLKREGAPEWTHQQIIRISFDQAFTTARVWASAIVRDKNLG